MGYRTVSYESQIVLFFIGHENLEGHQFVFRNQTLSTAKALLFFVNWYGTLVILRTAPTYAVEVLICVAML